MTDLLLNVLAVAPGPQTAAEVRDVVRRSGPKVEEFEVLQELRRLQNQGVVRVEGTRWRLLKMPANIKIAPQTRKAFPLPPGGGASSADKRTNAAISTVLASPPEPTGRWSQFRAMGRYYMDCLLQDEAPDLKGFVENEDDTWIAVPQIPWARLAAGGDFAVSLAREQAPFQRNRVRRGEDECVYLCYPLMFVKPKGVSGFVVPLFAQPMTADWRAGVLHLEPDGPIAVNGAWLGYRFPKSAERAAFLRAMGFLNDANGEDDNGDSTTPGPKDFARLAQDAAHYVHDPGKFAEHIEPLGLRTIEVDPVFRTTG
jgi:hypothetical protein